MANPFAQFAQPQTTGNPFSRFAPLAQPKTFERDEDEALYRQELAKEIEGRSKVRVPMGNEKRDEYGRTIYDQTPEEVAQAAVQQQRAKEGEQKEFDDSRTLGTRAADTATFLASIPVRTVTRGEAGIGDVVEKISPGMGNALKEREANFARANETGLEVLGAVGDVTAGIPMLSTMGAPLQGVGATAAALANKPLPKSAVARGVVRNERLADIEAFEGAGVKPFGPALTESGTAGVVKQLSDAPIVGAPVRNRLGQAIEETRDAGERIAGEYGDAKTFRDVGNVAEKGLDRFKEARNVEPSPELVKQFAGDSAAATARSPARQTSIKTKQDTLYDRAWKFIPPGLREDGAVLDKTKGRTVKDEPALKGGMPTARGLLDEIQARNTRMVNASGDKADAVTKPIASSGLLGGMLDAIQNPKWNPTLGTMRDLRSGIRRLASGVADTEKNTLSKSDMARLQSAITQDMIAVLRNNADRFAKTGETQKAANLRSAEHAFKRADQFTRASALRLERIEKLYGAQSSEQLALGIVKDAMGGRKGGNFARLSALRRSLKDDEWGDVSSGVIRELGRPVGSARGAAEDAGFSVNSFMTNWRNMSEEGKNVLFNRPGDSGKALRTSLDRFVRVADKMANFEAMANTSRSATNALGMTGLASIFTAAQQAMTGNFQTAAAAGSVAAGTYAFGKFMTSPLYVRWLTRAAELSGDPGKLKSLRVHARELARLAAKEPDLPLQEMMTGAAIALNQAIDAQAQAPGSGTQPQRR